MSTTLETRYLDGFVRDHEWTLIDAVFEQQRRAAQDPDDTREVPFP